MSLYDEERTHPILIEPIGVRILGEIDPTTLNKAQFLSSPNLLFHGSAKPLTFIQDYDYSSEEYFADADGSETLGAGFYTTEERDVAENYSDVRRLRETCRSVAELLPFQAKVFDFKSKGDPLRNAFTPKELFEKWFYSFKDYYIGQMAERGKLPWHVVAMESEYWEYLMRAFKRVQEIGQPDFDLRAMLETGPFPPLKSGNYPSPPWTRRFSDFMRSEGYDGVVYVEGGEGENRKYHTTYVFYNLSKIGTFETWQERKK